MTTPPTPPGWRVGSLTVNFGGSIQVSVQSPEPKWWYVDVSRDGDWEIADGHGNLPESHERAAIMATVSAYAIRRAFGDNTR